MESRVIRLPVAVPTSGGVTESFTVSNDFIPEGYGFTVCVTNERNDKENCRQTIRERGSSQTDVFIFQIENLLL